MQSITELKAEIKRLKDEKEYMRVRFKEVDRICGKLILTMQCAVIESEHGKGDKAAVDWIYDALWGPGELPPDGETNAQEYADREFTKIDADLIDCYDFFRKRRIEIE